MSVFYITTPIYYVNDKPHLGSAYSTVNADVLARYHKLFGDDVCFLTGTDEHGQKVEQAAAARKKDPQAHCDEMAEVFKTAWKNMSIDYDIFFRTTADFHKKTVQQVMQELWDKGDIFADTYEGWYCVSEEIFYTDKELVNGKTPTGKEVVRVSEKNYFFKMSKYQQKLIDHINKNPRFILPENRRNEVLGFLRQPLGDLCISRPKTRLKWGIEIPFDHDYVTYVWFDALLNYATGVGLKQAGREKDYKKWWDSNQVVHLIGKDILITHAVYWPTMLMAAGMTLPKTIFAHGWLLNKDNEKMSKSRGSVMNSDEVSKQVGVDPLRFFLVKDILLGNDAPVSHELIINSINTDLANNLGNLLSRTTNLIEKFFEGRAPQATANDEATKALIDLAKHTPNSVLESVQNLAPSEAIGHVMKLLTETNRYLENKAPWKTAKTDLADAGGSLYVALEVLRIAGSLLWPVMPTKMAELLKWVDSSQAAGKMPDWDKIKTWGHIKPGAAVTKAEPLFPRIVVEV